MRDVAHVWFHVCHTAPTALTDLVVACQDHLPNVICEGGADGQV